LAEGTRVNLTVARGAADNSQSVRAVIEAGGANINRELIDQGYGRFRKDLYI
jgi:endonuclease YncB( thermonuclease family)